MTRKKLLALALLAGLLLALVALRLRHPEVANLAPRQGPIVVLGDSLTVGVGSPDRTGYVGLLEERLGVELVNKGVSGDTTEGGLKRLDRDVLAQRPALVIVELGGNDVLQRVDPETTFANLDEIVSRIQEQGAPVLLLGVQTGVFSDKHESSFRELASRRRTGYVPNILRGILTDATLKDDPIHPNDRGYERVADRVEPELRWMLHKMGRL